MNSILSDSFLTALRRGTERYGTGFTRSTVQCISKLNENIYSGASQERLRHENQNLWSGRASDDYRVIYYQINGIRILLYVDKHDQAYNWIRDRKFDFSEEANKLNIRYQETVEEQRIISYEYQDEKILDRYSDEYLISIGIPKEIIATIRQFELNQEWELLDFIEARGNPELSSLILNLITGDLDRIYKTLESNRPRKMKFHAYETLARDKAQIKVWEWLKEAFKEDEGVVYYRYPVFTKQGNLNREPDILMLHRKYGLWIFECKSYELSNIQSIQGQEWKLSDWDEESEMPVAQAEDQIFAIRKIFDSKHQTREKISLNFRVALPNISISDWQKSDFNKLPATQDCVLCRESLTPVAIKQYLEEKSPVVMHSDEDWQLILAVLGGTLNSNSSRSIASGTSPDNPARVIKFVEEKLKSLDENQQKIAFEIPDGPQRLRGLAGTGKTVLLAKKAAKIHVKYPSWKIGFVFFTRALYDQIIDLVALFHREMHPDHKDPNWSNLKILHAWGSKEQDGFYRSLCQKIGVQPKNLNNVRQELERNTSPAESFEYVCQSLHDSFLERINSIYDVIIIDEGQDLPPVFYQLAYKSLAQPKRLYWGYDEAQGIGSLMVPTSEAVFGRDIHGNLIVDLSGSHEGGILKTHKIKKCYRTPRLLLMTAHAINMGLFRPQGPLQGVTQIKDWEDLGYTITDGDFLTASVQGGKTVTITRTDIESPHPIDQKNFDLQKALGSVLSVQIFPNEVDEQEWIAQSVAQDIKNGLSPSDIFITAITGNREKEYFRSLKEHLRMKPTFRR